jgi:hypothetical protein
MANVARRTHRPHNRLCWQYLPRRNTRRALARPVDYCFLRLSIMLGAQKAPPEAGLAQKSFRLDPEQPNHNDGH